MAIRRTAGTARTRWPRRSCVIVIADDSVSESLDELELSASYIHKVPATFKQCTNITLVKYDTI